MKLKKQNKTNMKILNTQKHSQQLHIDTYMYVNQKVAMPIYIHIFNAHCSHELLLCQCMNVEIAQKPVVPRERV